MSEVHILNGDALAERFPKEIPGTRIIMRECLISGPVVYGSIQELTTVRKTYLEDLAGTPVDYGKVTDELEKIVNLPEGSKVNLWFEYDLYCQINMWYVLDLINQKAKQFKISLVLPDDRSPYGFHKYNNDELIELLNQKFELSDAQQYKVWEAYCTRSAHQLIHYRDDLSRTNTKMADALSLQIERIYGKEDTIIQKLRDVVNELDSTGFGQIFKAFQTKHPYYGLGDLQVKSLLNQI